MPPVPMRRRRLAAQLLLVFVGCMIAATLAFFQHFYWKKPLTFQKEIVPDVQAQDRPAVIIRFRLYNNRLTWVRNLYFSAHIDTTGLVLSPNELKLYVDGEDATRAIPLTGVTAGAILAIGFTSDYTYQRTSKLQWGSFLEEPIPPLSSVIIELRVTSGKREGSISCLSFIGEKGKNLVLGEDKVTIR